ncbi:MAG: hypothetical protein FWE67_08425 [Planctomycetaceae bacterium]|nr:hypothetical protein [Planctomycetaceae bacterium]
MPRLLLSILFIPILCIFLASPLHAATLKVGAAQVDITPPKSVPLQGQFQMRISQGVETPLTVNVAALESIDGDKQLDSVIFVAADLISIRDDFLNAIQKKVAAKDASIDVNKLVISGTHTHTGPTLSLGREKLPVSEKIMDYPEAIDFTAERISDAVCTAWKNRKAGKIAFGLDFAVIGGNRRTVYADGRAQMYGSTNQKDFRGMEGMSDRDVGSLFFLDANNKLLAVAVNVSCPSQVVEHRMFINADYWHYVREALAKRFGENIVVLGWCGASGDNTPRAMYRKAAVERMNSLRKLDDMQEIARKIDRAVADTWEVVRKTATADVPLAHRVEPLQLPMRKITEKEYADAKAECEKIDVALKADPKKKFPEVGMGSREWQNRIVMRYNEQQKSSDADILYASPINVVRLGETAIFTNQFEMFTDFGIQMKARSPAVQTFVIQLVGGGTYLPSEKGVSGGGYSAVPQSNRVGPEGGQVLVEETLKIAKEMFAK